MEDSDQTETKSREDKATQCRVLLSNDANSLLDDLVAKVNKDWDGGRVTKPQLASWAIKRLAEKMSEQVLSDLRLDHFDKIAYLEALLKKAKKTGEMPSELDRLEPETVTSGKKAKSPKPESK